MAWKGEEWSQTMWRSLAEISHLGRKGDEPTGHLRKMRELGTTDPHQVGVRLGLFVSFGFYGAGD